MKEHTKEEIKIIQKSESKRIDVKESKKKKIVKEIKK